MSYQGLSNHKVHFEPESVFQKAQYALPKGPPRLGTGRGTPSSYRARDARHLCPLWGQSRHYCRLANHVRSAPNFGHAAALRQLTRWAKLRHSLVTSRRRSLDVASHSRTSYCCSNLPSYIRRETFSANTRHATYASECTRGVAKLGKIAAHGRDVRNRTRRCTSNQRLMQTARVFLTPVSADQQRSRLPQG